MEFRLHRALTSIGQRKEMGKAILEIAKEKFGGDHGLLLEKEETTGGLREIAKFGKVEEMLDQDMRIFAQYASDNPMDPESVIIAPDAKAIHKLSARKSVRRDMTLGVLIFPLISGDNTIGVIYLGEKKKGELRIKQTSSKRALSLGRTFGEIIGLHRTMQRLHRRNRSLQKLVRKEEAFESLVGISEEIQRVKRSMELVVPTDIAVTLLGDVGTGKRMIAEMIHRLSPRKKRPFLQLALKETPENLIASLLFGGEAAGVRHKGALREANGGTLYIEDLELLPLKLQSDLVKALDEGRAKQEGASRGYQVDVRLVASSTKNLKELFESKKLRKEFYLKLNVFPVLLPSIKDRLEDLPLLVEYFVDSSASTYGKTIDGVSSDVYDFLGTWDWPGNLDELEQEIRLAVLRTPNRGELSASSLSNYLVSRQQPVMMDPGEGTLKQRIAQIEKRMIISTLERNRHNQSVTADQLGLSRQALINKLHRYGIETGRKYKRKLRELALKAQMES